MTSTESLQTFSKILVNFSAADPHTQASALRSGEQLVGTLRASTVDFSFEIGGVECKGTLTKQTYKELAKPILERLRAPQASFQDAEKDSRTRWVVLLVGAQKRLSYAILSQSFSRHVRFVISILTMLLHWV